MSAPSAAVDVALVFALAIEADAFERLVDRRRDTEGARFTFSTGTVAGRRIAWCVSGVGPVAAAEATRQLIAGHHPRRVITAGFAGALDPGLHRGMAVRPGIVVTPSSAAPLHLAAIGPATSSVLSLVTVDRVAATIEAKRTLAEATGAHLVDMETFAVAEVATAAGVSCAAVRVISDDAAETLPAEVALLAQPQSRLRRFGALVGAVSRRPRSVGDLWQLWERAVVDARTLARAVVDVIREQC